MTTEPFRVGIVGCGNIARPYARTLVTYPEVRLVGVTDLDPARSRALAEEAGCAVYPDLDAMLADPQIDLIVNLSYHTAHHPISKAALEAGKHVYSEKPLALTSEHASELVELARSKGLRLGCSPFTFLGAPPQAAWRAIRAGELGTVRVAYAEVNWGRIETWHPDPASFYEVGPLFDVGVYPLTILTAFLGPARKVFAYGRVLHPHRVTKTGVPFSIDVPDFIVAAIELESGVLVRLTTNFYVTQKGRQTGIQFHGDIASLDLESWHDPNSRLEIATFDEAFAPYGDYSAHRMEWGRGVRDMAQAIIEGRPHRVSGELAAHVVEILCAIASSVEQGQAVEVHSTFTPPAPLEPESGVAAVA